MSLLIKGMEMPKGCDQCRCCVPDDVNSDSASYYCALNNYIAWNTEHDISTDIEIGCPLVEIPTPHGRPIDADRLIAVLKSTTAVSQSNYDLFNHIIGLIEHQPTIIEI